MVITNDPVFNQYLNNPHIKTGYLNPQVDFALTSFQSMPVGTIYVGLQNGVLTVPGCPSADDTAAIWYRYRYSSGCAGGNGDDWIRLCACGPGGIPAVTLTEFQDILNRVSLNLSTQILNIPPAIACRISSLSLSVYLDYSAIRQISGGMAVDYDLSGASMAQVDQIVIPRSGRYNVSGSWGCSGPLACTGFVMGAALGVNGAWSGRYTAPGVGGAWDEQVAFHLPGQYFAVGSILTLGGYTSCTDGSFRATSAYLAAEYIEGT